MEGPSKKPFCTAARMFVGGRLNSTVPREFAPGTSRLVTAKPPVVGSWLWISGDRHSGGKTIGGGLGCGAKATRFSTPNEVLTARAVDVAGAREPAPPACSVMRFRPVVAQMLPPPDWHPKRAPLLKVLSSE